MPINISRNRLLYVGLLASALYGLLLRILFGINTNAAMIGSGLFSITFIWVVPVLIGIIPLLFASNKQLQKIQIVLFMPPLSVLLFFCFALMSGLEDIICLVIVAIPFMLGAMIGGLIFSKVLLHIRKKKGIIYAIFFVPLLSALVENKFPPSIETYSAESAVLIHSTEDIIWKNIVRVNPMQPGEYKRGFFNYAGIPTPLYATLDADTIGATRTGHFEGGLIFNETVTVWKRNEEVSFSIRVIPSSIRSTVFDQHVLKGGHFKFLQASYTLKRIDDKTILLKLTSSYQLGTNINGYASFWGKQILTDFQDRLLQVIKKRSTIR